MSRRRPINWMFYSVIFGVVAAALIYAALVPFLNEYVFKSSELGWSSTESSPYSNYSFYEQFVRRLGAFITSGWFFILGACIGSFINVVVWRMPLGKSALFRPSFCPRCHAKIRLIDNIPVLGWVKLRGRCRKCRLPISFRYPLVEFLFGTIFLILFLAEYLTGAANIPGSAEYTQTGVVYLVWFMKSELMSMYLFHCGLISFLLAVGLMRFDNSAIPIRLVLFVLVVGIGLVIAFPHLQTVRYWGVMEMYKAGVGGSEPYFPTWVDRITTPGLGLLVGAVMGAWIGFVSSNLMKISKLQNQRTFFAMLVIGSTVGASLGWQAVLSVFAIQALLLLALLPILVITRQPRSKLRIYCEQFCLAVLIHLLAWEQMEQWNWWISGDPNWFALAGAIFVATIGFVVFANQCEDQVDDDSRTENIEYGPSGI